MKSEPSGAATGKGQEEQESGDKRGVRAKNAQVPQMALYVFFRDSGFYPLELRDDDDARANAESNPGTIRVLKMSTEEQVWPLN